ncbi:MAG: BrnA antitoxin family protein [Rhodoferax sp.]|uniref:BrnA antitoxin family protein n=1 Tax=Rhodoferax sp. TaxID=50421 RepID=UPI0026090A96|nr:BrnA antitoxin family protein [Rhodoferax sp.]MDD5336569.1 BrnA antitoxin family protein [Rhodoferax sp.]
MQQTLKTKSGRTIIRPTKAEDAAITAAALSDPDAQPLTNAQLKTMRPMGRPRIANPKAPLTMRIDADVLEALRTSGQGWQTRVNALLREAVSTGKV